MALRFLGARRISRQRDASTSFTRQKLGIEATAAALGGTVVEWADDPSVSAIKLPPQERPGLSEWLNKPDEYDGIIWLWLDRAVRNMHDMSWLGQWAKKHQKRLIFAEGPAGGGRLELDMTQPWSELILMIFAFAAQMEGSAIKERTGGAAEFLRSVGRWGGGRVPFSRMPVPHPIEKDDKGDPAGYWLARHPETGDILDEMISRVLSGDTYHSVANWLNAEHKGMTPANHRNALGGRELDPALRWNPGMVSSLLRQESLRGYKMLADEIVRDEVGEPVLCGDVLVDNDTWYRLQVEMDSRDSPNENRSDLHPLLGVLFCGSCSGKLYQGWLSPGPNRKEAVRQYRCAAKAHGRVCRKPAYVVAAPVDKYVSAQFIERVGDMEVIEIIRYPGVDHTAEIADLKSTVEQLGLRIGELGGSGPAVDVLMGQLKGRSDRLEKMLEMPVQPPRTEQRGTGKAYRELWAEKDSQGHLGMLRDAGVRVEVGETYRGARDVTKRLSFAMGQHADPVQAALDAIALEEELSG